MGGPGRSQAQDYPGTVVALRAVTVYLLLNCEFAIKIAKHVQPIYPIVGPYFLLLCTLLCVFVLEHQNSHKPIVHFKLILPALDHEANL